MMIMKLRRLLPLPSSASASPRRALALLLLSPLSSSLSSLVDARRSGWGASSSSASASSALAFGSPFDVVARDFQALTRRVTAHHILLPKSRDVALALKQRIRNEVSPPASPAAAVRRRPTRLRGRRVRRCREGVFPRRGHPTLTETETITLPLSLLLRFYPAFCAR